MHSLDPSDSTIFAACAVQAELIPSSRNRSSSRLDGAGIWQTLRFLLRRHWRWLESLLLELAAVAFHSDTSLSASLCRLRLHWMFSGPWAAQGCSDGGCARTGVFLGHIAAFRAAAAPLAPMVISSASSALHPVSQSPTRDERRSLHGRDRLVCRGTRNPAVTN